MITEPDKLLNNRVSVLLVAQDDGLKTQFNDAMKEIDAEVLFSDKVMNKINEKLSSEVVSKFSIRGRKEKIDLHKITV